MARDSTITFEQVADAAEKLKAASINPTARAVRDSLGTGSMATVLKHLQNWKDGQRAATGPIDTSIDPLIAKVISQQMVARVSEATADLNSRLAALQLETNALIAESEHLTAQLQVREAEVGRLHTENSELSGRAGQLGADLERRSEELQAARADIEKGRVDVATMNMRLESLPGLRDEIQRLQGALAETQREASDQRGDAGAARAELKAVEQARIRAERQADDALAQVQSLTESITKERVEHAARREQLAEAERMKTEALSSARALAAGQAQVDATISQLRDEIAALRQENTVKKTM